VPESEKSDGAGAERAAAADVGFVTGVSGGRGNVGFANRFLTGNLPYLGVLLR
jgi:hypothetical protein